MLVTRSDSISSVSGRRLFYGPGHSDGHAQQRSGYDKERLGIGTNPKKRSSRQSKSNFSTSHKIDSEKKKKWK